MMCRTLDRVVSGILEVGLHHLFGTICKEKFKYFYQNLHEAVERFLPVCPHRVHSSDKPWMTSQIKALISKRQRCLAKHRKDSPLCKSLQNKVQRSVQYTKWVFYDGKVKHLRESNASKWWKDVKYLAWPSGSNRSWFYQLLDGSSTESLCGKINKFAELTSGFVPLTPANVMDIEVDHRNIKRELFVTPGEAGIALCGVKIRKTPSPDGIPNIVLKWFDFEPAPVVAHMYNSSLMEGYLPELFKCADVRPLPNVNRK